MTVYKGKTPGTWRVIVWSPRKIGEKSVPNERIVEGSRRDARLYEAQFRIQLRSQAARTVRGVPRFTSFCVQTFAPYIQKRVSENTWKQHYTWQIEALCDHFGDTPLTDFSTLLVESYQNSRDAKPSTVNGEVQRLMSILTYARKSHQIPVPEIEYKPLRTMKGHPKTWSQEQVLNIIATAERISPWQAPMLVFGFNTGCRKGEIVACEWSWLDFNNRMVRIPVNEYWHPKDAEPREVPMSDALYATLKAPAQPWKPTRGLWPPRKHKRWVFPTRDGGRFADFPDDPFQRVLEEAGVVGSPHWMRHTFASIFLENHPDLPMLAKIMGHSSTYITELYGSFRRDHLATARNAVNIGAGPIAVANLSKRA